MDADNSEQSSHLLWPGTTVFKFSARVG